MRQLRKDIIRQLAPYLDTHERRTFARDALYDTPIPEELDWQGGNRQFAAMLVDVCMRYGTDPVTRKHTLVLVLETLKERVGDNKKQQLDALIDTMEHHIEEGRSALGDTDPIRPAVIADTSILDELARNDGEPTNPIFPVPDTAPAPPHRHKKARSQQRSTRNATEPAHPYMYNEETVPAKPDKRVVDVTPGSEENTRPATRLHIHDAHFATVIKDPDRTRLPDPPPNVATQPNRGGFVPDGKTMPSPPVREAEDRRFQFLMRNPWRQVMGLSTLLTLSLGLVFISGLAGSGQDTTVTTDKSAIPATSIADAAPLIATPIAARNTTVRSSVSPPVSDIPEPTIPTVVMAVIPTATQLSAGGVCAINVDTVLDEAAISCLFSRDTGNIKAHPALMELADDHARYLTMLKESIFLVTDVYRFESGNALADEQRSASYPDDASLQMLVVTSDEAIVSGDFYREVERRELDLTAAYTVYGYALRRSLNGRRTLVLILG